MQVLRWATTFEVEGTDNPEWLMAVPAIADLVKSKTAPFKQEIHELEEAISHPGDHSAELQQLRKQKKQSTDKETQTEEAWSPGKHRGRRGSQEEDMTEEDAEEFGLGSIEDEKEGSRRRGAAARVKNTNIAGVMSLVKGKGGCTL